MNNLADGTHSGENKSNERALETRSSLISDRESEAQLLLNLSEPSPNKNLYNKFTQQPNDNQLHEKEMTELNLFDGGKRNATTIKHKLPITPVPVEKRKYGTVEMEPYGPKKIRILDEKVIERKDNQSQSDEFLQVSTEDYNLLKFIKENGLTSRQLCRLPFRDHQNSDVDVNNNTKQQLNLETPLVNLSCDDKDVPKKLFHNSTNRLVAFKLIEALQKFEKSRNKEKAVKQVKVEKRNLINIINEVLTKIGNKNHDSFVRVSFNKMTQTELNFMQDAECTTADKFINKDENIFKHEANKDDITNSVQAEQLSVHSIQFQVNEGQQVQQIQGSSASAIEKLHTTNTLGSRINNPNTKTMRGSELTDQYYNYPNTWSSSFGAKNAGQSMARPHRFMPPAATAAATGTASFPFQQPSGPNTQAPTTGAMPPPYKPMGQPHTGPRWNITSNQNLDRFQPNYRPMKNTPLRTAPYNAGPRFMPPAPVQGKYNMPVQPLSERFRTMEALQKEWASKLANYPNTAWDHSFKNNFNGNN